jgi:hypothetical protein
VELVPALAAACVTFFCVVSGAPQPASPPGAAFDLARGLAPVPALRNGMPPQKRLYR